MVGDIAGRVPDRRDGQFDRAAGSGGGGLLHGPAIPAGCLPGHDADAVPDRRLGGPADAGPAGRGVAGRCAVCAAAGAGGDHRAVDRAAAGALRVAAGVPADHDWIAVRDGGDQHRLGGRAVVVMGTGVTEGELLLAIVIVLAATIIAGLAGFGLSIVSVPPLLLLFDPGTVIALNKILTLGTTWIILVEAWRHISWRWIARVLPTALVGLFIGSYLLRVLDAEVIKVIAGVIVISLALLLLTWQPQELKERPWMAPLIGLASGTSSTSVGMSGPPLVLFFTVMSVPVQAFRATAAMY